MNCNTKNCNTKNCNTKKCNTKNCNTKNCNTKNCNTKNSYTKNSYIKKFERTNTTSEFDCYKYFQPNTSKELIKSAELWKIPPNQNFDDSQITKEIQSNCSEFLDQRKYFFQEPSNDEKDFPIAYSIMVYKTASQVERLFRMIYRPWNYYCFHIDTKSNPIFERAIRELVGCVSDNFKNVIITENRIDVRWGEMSVLTADLSCMKELYERYKNWKYFINLTGQEFPLKTNAELVKILKAFKGANNVQANYSRRFEERIPKIQLPFPIIWYTGSVHITVNFQFVSFIFESPKSKIILDSLKDRKIPDETFFSTLNYNPQFRIPGSFIGNPDENQPQHDRLGYFITRYKNWGQYRCESKFIVREICIWGVGDLPKLVNAPHLFANKFHENFQPVTLKCLERWIYDKVEKQTRTGLVDLNVDYYSSLPFVNYRYVPPSE